MGTVRLGNFPSLNNKKLTDCIDKGILFYFLNHFPRNFFTNMYMDNQTGSSGNYNINPEGDLIKIETGKKINNPSMRFNIKHGANNTVDPFGGDIWNVNQQPGAFAIDTDLTGYRPILYDPYGVIIALNERTIRNTFDINMTFDSKDDQLACCNYLDSNLKMNYVSVVEIKTFIPMHRLMMEYLRASIFKSEINVLSKMKAESKEKLEYQQKINIMFTEHMYKFSENHIKPYKLLDPNNDNHDYVFGYWQTQRVTIHFDKYEADDGNKKGNAWTNFNVNLNGWIEYGNPIGFITSVPAIIRGSKNNWMMKTSSETDRNNYYHMMKFKEVFKDTRRLAPVDGDYYQHFYFEREIMMSSKVEDFNIIDDVITQEETPSHYAVMKAILSTVNTQEEFDNLFKVVIYKDDTPLDKHEYSIDKKFNFHIINCDLTVPYYIDVFVNKCIYANKIDNMKDFLKKLGINTDEPNYKPPLNDLMVNYNQNGIGTINMIMGTSYDSDNEDVKEFIRAMPDNFLTIDTEFEYYTRIYENGESKYYKVSPKQILTNRNMELFIFINGEYVLIDIDNILIPDPKIDFYIYDRNSDKYIKCKDLKKFDRLQNYYITTDQLNAGKYTFYVGDQKLQDYI